VKVQRAFFFLWVFLWGGAITSCVFSLRSLLRLNSLSPPTTDASAPLSSTRMRCSSLRRIYSPRVRCLQVPSRAPYVVQNRDSPEALGWCLPEVPYHGPSVVLHGEPRVGRGPRVRPSDRGDRDARAELRSPIRILTRCTSEAQPAYLVRGAAASATNANCLRAPVLPRTAALTSADVPVRPIAAAWSPRSLGCAPWRATSW